MGGIGCATAHMNGGRIILVIAWVAGLMPCAGIWAGEIHDAVRSGDVLRVKRLLSENPDQVNVPQDGRTALHMAVYRGQLNMVELLLAHNADLRAKDSYGRTPLHEAIASGSHEMVALLLDHKADINAVDKQGCTPLHWAVARGNIGMVKLLLVHDPDVNAVDNRSHTPLDVTTRPEIAVLLQLYGAKTGEAVKRSTGGSHGRQSQPGNLSSVP